MQVRAKQLDPHQERHAPGAQKQEERGDEVQVPDHLVVGRGQPVREDIPLALGPWWRCDDRPFDRAHCVLPDELSAACSTAMYAWHCCGGTSFSVNSIRLWSTPHSSLQCPVNAP